MTNVLQIKISEKEKECRQFNIIENAGGGDCLFLALLEFLRESGNTNITVPNNADDLRHLAVIYLLTTTGDEQRLNFDRFKEALVVNLQDYIPNLAKYGDNNNVDAEIVNSYWEYMTTPGKEGTFAELCAIAELFSFAGFLIRQNDPNNYNCYEFGFTDENDENKPIAYLLFSGNTSNGHFRLLKPSHRPTNSSLLPGKYRFVREIASPHHFKITIIEPLVKDNTQFQCDLCEQSFQTQRGLRILNIQELNVTEISGYNESLTVENTMPYCEEI